WRPGAHPRRPGGSLMDGIRAAKAPRPVAAYPHARRVGDPLILSGLGPRNPANHTVPGSLHAPDGALVDNGTSAPARPVCANARAVLEASGARWEDLVDVTVFLTDMARDFTAYNAVWAEYFPDPATAPCRTTVGIDALPTPIAIELKCVAVVR